MGFALPLCHGAIITRMVERFRTGTEFYFTTSCLFWSIGLSFVELDIKKHFIFVKLVPKKRVWEIDVLGSGLPFGITFLFWGNSVHLSDSSSVSNATRLY